MFRLISSFFIAFTLIATGSHPPASADDTPRLTVMTYNIHHGVGTDRVLSLPRIAKVIEAADADVIALQEVDRHYSGRSAWADQPAELARLLHFSVVYGANINNPPPREGAPRSQYGTAILSRYPIVSWKNYPVPSSPGAEPRGLLRAQIDIQGARVTVANAHMSPYSATDRRAQATEIVRLAGPARRTLVLGDMNAESGTPEIRTFESAYTDVWQKVGSGPGFTYHSLNPSRRVDMVYGAAGVRPRGGSVVTSATEHSDHFPVVAEVELPG